MFWAGTPTLPSFIFAHSLTAPFRAGALIGIPRGRSASRRALHNRRTPSVHIAFEHIHPHAQGHLFLLSLGRPRTELEEQTSGDGMETLAAADHGPRPFNMPRRPRRLSTHHRRPRRLMRIRVCQWERHPMGASVCASIFGPPWLPIKRHALARSISLMHAVPHAYSGMEAAHQIQSSTTLVNITLSTNLNARRSHGSR